MRNSALVHALASSLLAGEARAEQIAARAERTLGKRWLWMDPLALRYVEKFADGVRPRHRDVVHFLAHDRDFQDVLAKNSGQLSVRQWLTEDSRMQPVEAAREWRVPVIESVGELADWLAITPGELDWFADLKGLGYKRGCPKLQHYRYRVLTKRSGDLRLIEAPKQKLKAVQRRILAGILDQIPLHAAVHGFRKTRSIKTFVSPHVGQRVVLRMDLREFFPSVRGVRVQALFRTVGYPERVADLLGGICTNAAPASVLGNQTPSLYRQPHLPQGTPTSPALANLCFYRGDCRLAGLAQSLDAVYTRYADDLAFSGGEAFEPYAAWLPPLIAAILTEEGFAVNHRKTRLMRRGVRQQLAGLVVNDRVNVKRVDFDRLKATLNNCVRLGPDSQNHEGHADFRAHLTGRVGFVEMVNPEKCRRLRAIFDRISWQ